MSLSCLSGASKVRSNLKKKKHLTFKDLSKKFGNAFHGTCCGLTQIVPFLSHDLAKSFFMTDVFLFLPPDVPQPELMLTTTRGRATVAGLDSSQEYALQVLVLNGTTERLLAKRRFTCKRHTEGDCRYFKGCTTGKNGGKYFFPQVFELLFVVLGVLGLC